MKLIFAVCVYKYILLGFFFPILFCFFNQSCCLVHSKVTFCFSQIFFLMFFSMSYCIFLGSKLTLKEKVVAKDAKMGKFHHTEAKKVKNYQFPRRVIFRQ